MGVASLHSSYELVRFRPSQIAISNIAEESEVESRKHQNDTNIHCQPFPKAISEEREIHADDDDYHHHGIKHSSYLSGHLPNTPWMTSCWSE
jgi:hypothetical protein